MLISRLLAISLFALIFFSCSEKLVYTDQSKIKSLVNTSTETQNSNIITKQTIIISSMEELKRLTSQMGMQLNFSPLDFTRQTLIVASAGQRNTGGYDVEIKRITRQGGRMIVDLVL